MARKPVLLNGIGISLVARFERLGELSDLKDAISMLRNAVGFTPHGHPEKADRLRRVATLISFMTTPQTNTAQLALFLKNDMVTIGIACIDEEIKRENHRHNSELIKLFTRNNTLSLTVRLPPEILEAIFIQCACDHHAKDCRPPIQVMIRYLIMR
ncbi:hypothetical protein EV363DRAFT_1580639 [Boletus edulis]|nr:hypothetical protein EV363DRAFT_1580639 [Boletus edulis]